MSIAGEILRLQSVKSNILNAIAAKGVSVPIGAKLADCPELIYLIGGGEGTVTIGGRNYKTVTIGGVTWLAENLDFKFYGLKIGSDDSSDAPGTPRAAYYNNDEATYGVNGNKYGLLYNWYAVTFLNTYKDQLIPGWRVASYYDWKALATDAGGDSTAGTKLKSKTGWDSGAGTDDFGFAAFPAGKFLSSFDGLGVNANFWTTSEYSTPDKGWCRMINTSSYLSSTAYDKSNCFSVRLVRDA